jgi:hypothetical protein
VVFNRQRSPQFANVRAVCECCPVRPPAFATVRRIEQALSDVVARRLEAELGSRGLLLAADEMAAAQAEVAQRGARLLTWVIDQCYPIGRQGGRALALEFESERDPTRVEAALAFGAVTAQLLAPGGWRDPEPFVGSVETVCAMFIDLGIGLVDGLCDHDAVAGASFLRAL